MAKAGVLGAGSWGTALALLLDKNGHDVTVWSIDQAEVEMLDREREHKSKLPGVKLPQTMKFTNEIQEANYRSRFHGACGAFSVYEGNCKEDGSVCERRTENRQCGKGNRGKHTDDTF